jgi:hypothetical protein
MHASEIARDFSLALAQYLETRNAAGLDKAQALGRQASAQGMSTLEIVSLYTRSMVSCRSLADGREFLMGAAFLQAALASHEFELATDRAKALERLANECQTPLTTLRLTLQVALGNLRSGEGVEASVLSKGISQVDKLAARISELLSRSVEAPPPPKL